MGASQIVALGTAVVLTAGGTMVLAVGAWILGAAFLAVAAILFAVTYRSL